MYASLPTSNRSSELTVLLPAPHQTRHHRIQRRNSRLRQNRLPGHLPTHRNRTQMPRSARRHPSLVQGLRGPIEARSGPARRPHDQLRRDRLPGRHAAE